MDHEERLSLIAHWLSLGTFDVKASYACRYALTIIQLVSTLNSF